MFGRSAFLMLSFTASSIAVSFSPEPVYAFGLNTDVERAACHISKVRALRGERQARTGEISEHERRALWLKYKDCLGSKDKNYLLPEEFRYK